MQNYERNLILSESERESISYLTYLCSSAEQPAPSDTENNSIDKHLIDSKPKSSKEMISSELGTQQEIVRTTSQFLSFFSGIEQEMEEGQDDGFKMYLSFLEKNRDQIQVQLDRILSIGGLLDELQYNYELVSSKTMKLQDGCEQLLDEERHLVSVSNDISKKLAIFQELEYISSTLNTPGESLVEESGFLNMLKKLDDCLEFVALHPNYKESPVYNMRFRQSMTRGLTLIKLYFVESLRSLNADINAKLSLRNPNELVPANIHFSLFYVKFKSLAGTARPLLSEIESRCIGHPEYLALLRDCITNLTNIRLSLLEPHIIQTIKEKHADTSLISFTSSGTAYMLRIAADEYSLLREFFALGDEEIRIYIESLSALLSDQIRPLILKETRFDILADLCSTLLVHFSSDADNEIPDSPETAGKPEAVKFIAETILADAQTRLIRRALEYIQTDIRQFKPREKDLTVLARGPDLPQPMQVNSGTRVADVLQEPSPLLPRKRSSVAMSPRAEAAFESQIPNPDMTNMVSNPKFGGGEWFPTLQRTINLLAKLHASLPDASFVDLAQEAVDACIISIEEVAVMLTSLHGPTDGQLFIIKNLLQLRESISFYDSRLIRSTRNVNISELFQAIRVVLSNPLVLQNYGNLAKPFASIQEDDIRLVLDSKLKYSCEHFILDTSKTATQPLLIFLKTVEEFLSKNSRGELYKQPFVSEENLVLTYQKFMSSLTENLQNAIKKLKQYLGDINTQLTLMKIARGSILSQANEFLDIVKAAGVSSDKIGDEAQIAMSSNIVLLPPVESLPTLWNYINDDYASLHVIRRTNQDSAFLSLGNQLFRLFGSKLVNADGEILHIIEQTISPSFNIRCYHLKGPIVSKASLSETTLTLEDILKEIPNGPAVFSRIQERISTFNELAVELQVHEILEDIQKLIADAHLLLSTLSEPQVKSRMRQLFIPTWDFLFAMIENMILEATYDIVYFKISKKNREGDEKLSSIFLITSWACLSAERIDLGLAALEFSKIASVRTPSAKIRAMEKAIGVLTAKKVISGDELLPLIIMTVIKSQVTNLQSDLAYVKDFSFEKNVDVGKTGYVISSFEAVLSYILTFSDSLIDNSNFHQNLCKSLVDGDLEMVKSFFEGPKPKFVDSEIKTFLDDEGNDAFACSLSFPHISQFLMERGYDPGSLNCHNDSYLHQCARKNLIDSAQRLISQTGLQVSQLNNRNETAFSIAVSNMYFAMADLFLGQAPLSELAPLPYIYQGLQNAESLHYLMKVGLSFDIFVFDQPLLSYYCANGFSELSSTILKEGVTNICEPDKMERSFLHHLCSSNGSVAKQFLEDARYSSIKNKILDMADIHLNTALHLAVMTKNYSMVQLLLIHKADIEALTLKNLTAYEISETDSNIQILILNARLLYKVNNGLNKFAISIFHPRNDYENQKMNFQIRSGRSADDIAIVERSLEDFSFLREMLLLESPESLVPEIQDLMSQQAVLQDVGRSDRGARIASQISDRLEFFLEELLMKFKDHELLSEFLGASDFNHEHSKARVVLKTTFINESLPDRYAVIQDIGGKVVYWHTVTDQFAHLIYAERKISEFCRKYCKLTFNFADSLHILSLHSVNPVFRFATNPEKVENCMGHIVKAYKVFSEKEVKSVCKSLKVCEQNYTLSEGMEGITYFHVLADEFVALRKNEKLLEADMARLGIIARSGSEVTPELMKNIDETYQTFSQVNKQVSHRGSKISYVAANLETDLELIKQKHAERLIKLLDEHVRNHVELLEDVFYFLKS